MAMNVAAALLPIVDGALLPAALRELLKPGEWMRGRDGELHRLPRFFYEVEAWTLALATPLTAHFGLWEFLDVDLREASPLRAFPRYVPCAVTLLATALEVFRLDVGLPVRIAANGGYRSPSHAQSRPGSTHCWGTAANIYGVGTDLVDSQERIERHAAAIRRLLPFAWVRPYGSEIGTADDHLHVDLGYVQVVPRGVCEEGAGNDR